MPTKNKLRSRWKWISLLTVVLLLTLSLTAACTDPNRDSLRMTVLGHPHTLLPGSQASLQLQLWDQRENEAAAEAQVTVQLDNAMGQTDLFTGQTDQQGLLTVQFDVPEAVSSPQSWLSISAEKDNRTGYYQQDVYIGHVYHVLVSTDKPVYQPGQTIHLRTLALNSMALKAAQNQPLTLTVQDPQGNRVMQRALTTSKWGVAATDFILDSQATSGDYTIIANMGAEISRRTVEVKPYKLPRFKLEFQADKPFYQPSETAQLTVEAAYFFGKPVSGGQVRVAGYTTDVSRQLIFELTDGQLDEQGAYSFELPLPESFVGQNEPNTAQVDLEITVIDTANHAERSTESLTVAAQPLLIEAIPESGSLRPGVENIIYLQTSYPNGQPAQADLTLDLIDRDNIAVIIQTDQLQTNENGLATITVTPPTEQHIVMNITARDAQAVTATEQIPLPTLWSRTQSTVLLRPEKTAYQVGEMLMLDALVAGQATTVFLDVVKNGQTFALTALPVQNGLAQAQIPLDGTLLGTLELHAYMITDDGQLVRDRRLVLVDPAPSQVEVQTDAESYRPGDTATLNITVRHQDEAQPSLLGLSIVDESVFAVGAQQPGFARTYFLLERQLLEPRYEIHGFTPLGGESSPYDRSYQDDSLSYHQPDALSRDQELARAGMLAQELAWAETQAPQPNDPAADSSTQRNRTGLLLFLTPLMGLIWADKRRRKHTLLLLVMLMGSFSLWLVACSSAPPAPAPNEAREAMVERSEMAPAQSKRPRLRQFFPETLLWLPELETDANGNAQVEVPIADSITTWRVSLLASDAEGNLGTAQVGLPVFQEFFIEPDLPRFLTQYDELSIPISIFNYLDEPQEIQLTVEPAAWFEFTESANLTVSVAANEVAAAYVPIRVTDFGQGEFKVTAQTARLSDAVLRQVEILPDGKALTAVENGQLTHPVNHTISLPNDMVPGTAQVTVKLFPGVVSQLVEGLEGMLRHPTGCFEQTSSSTYPNVLILDYLKTSGQLNPHIQLQAEQYINLGYQRLLTFEVDNHPGGFSLFGDPPPQTMLTAYGLMQFADMSHVSYVDPALLERTATFLLNQQQSDGHWGTSDPMTRNQLHTTAYIVWGLAEAGHRDAYQVGKAVSYLHDHATADMDPYALAIVVNALLAVDPHDETARTLLDSLLQQAKTEGDFIYWQSNLPTYLGGHDQVASIETTAMIAIALMKTNYRPDVAQSALDFLVDQRGSSGMFQTTQSTILALKALLLATKADNEGGAATVTITLDDGRTHTLTLDEGNANVVQQIRFDDLTAGEHGLTLSVEGERAVHYQIVTDYYLPWEKVAPEPSPNPAMRVAVSYDRTELQVNDTVQVTAEVELLAEGRASTVLVDLGLPPGFSPMTADLEALVENGLAERYELTGRQILLYLTNVPSGQVFQFPYRLQARFPIKAQTGRSQAYDYYTPDRQDLQPPQRITVRLGRS